MRNVSPHAGPHRGPRYDIMSTIGLATLVAALHLATLARRSSVHFPQMAQMTQMETRPPDETSRDPDRAPSNPTRSYSAGRLALTVGMVIVALAFQLQLMHVGSSRAR